MTGTRGRFTWRVALLGAVLVLGTLGLIGRLAYIQLLHHHTYETLALEEHSDKEIVRSTRGAILDRNGFPLATSLDVWDVYIDRRTWQNDPARAQQVANALAPRISMPADQLLAQLEDYSKGSIALLASGIDYNVGEDIQGLSLPGVTLAAANKRFYPEGDIASPLLGFLGRDHTGLSGIELDYDSELAGTPGYLYFERSGGGQPIAFGSTHLDPGTPGSNITLTIDRYIQQLIETDLDQEMRDHQASGGTIIVMDPKTGAILAMASRPAFKLSQLDLDNPDQSLCRNRAVTDLYEPGSVVKTLTMAAAIDLGLVNPNTTYDDTGTQVRGGATFHNWDFSANGIQTMTEVLQKSLNTGAIWVSDQLGPDNLYNYFAKFGFGTSTHSGLSGEADGLVRTNKDPGWYASDLATNSFGQGIAATPLQVITAISSLINGGKLMRPYVVKEIDGPNGTRTFDPVVVRQTISPQTSKTMVQMMEAVVDGVPGQRAQVKGYDVGGKTGTTLVSIPTGYALDSTIASFVGFAPVEDPAFIMLVKIDQPQDDPLGGIVAAPVFGKLAPQILSYLNISPSNQQLALSGN